MRVPERQQNLYFFLQEAEEKLLEFDKKQMELEAQGKDVTKIIKEGKELVGLVDYYLYDIREYGFYNEIISMFGQTSEDIEEDIKKRLKRLEKLIKEL